MFALLTGVDAVDLERFRRQITGRKSLHLIYGEEELGYCLSHRDPVPHLAGRFAAKEAAMKALGTGMSAGVTWRDIRVLGGSDGRPQLRLTGMAARRMQELGVVSTAVSISHTATVVVAQVVMLAVREDPAVVLNTVQLPDDLPVEVGEWEGKEV